MIVGGGFLVGIYVANELCYSRKAQVLESPLYAVSLELLFYVLIRAGKRALRIGGG